MKIPELQRFLEEKGYTFNGVDRYKKHDAVYYSRPPQITYARLQLTARVEDVPDSTWHALFSSNNGGERT